MAISKYVDASLILVPSGYKATKLYAQVPTNGDGDLAVTRASTRTRVNSDGNLEVIADNVPALDYSLSSCPALAIDPAATNVVLQSEDFGTTWAHQGGASVSTNTTTSPDGTANADTLSLNALAISRVEQTLTGLSTSTDYTVSCYVKVASGTKDFRFGYNDGTTTTTSSDITATTEWQRFSWNFTTSASHTNPDVRITNGTGAAAGDLIIWGAQVEAGDYATSYVKTTTTSVTRSNDSLELGSLITNAIVGATTGTLYIKGKFNVETGNISMFELSDGTSANRIRITSDDIQVVDTGLPAVINSCFVADADGYDDVLFAVRWNGTKAKVYVDGVAIGDTNFTAGASLTQFNLLGKNVTSWFKEIIFYNSALDNADMVTITTP